MRTPNVLPSGCSWAKGNSLRSLGVRMSVTGPGSVSGISEDIRKCSIIHSFDGAIMEKGFVTRCFKMRSFSILFLFRALHPIP